MSKDIKINLKDIPAQLSKLGQTFNRYTVIMFIVLLAIVYGYLLLKITTLSSVQPTSSDVDTQVSQLSPRIDESAVKQLQGLEDNSVNVQTLFDQARSNPFNE